MSRLLSESSVRAISALGAGLNYDEDVGPALAAVGLEAVRARAGVRVAPGFTSMFFPSTRDHIGQSLANLDLSDEDVVGRALRFTARIARVYAVSTNADGAILMRLANSLADDAQRIETVDVDVGSYDSGVRQGPGGDMARVTINRDAIARMMREIQGEFDKHTIRIPVNADGSPWPVSGTTNVYNGPVIHGNADGAQLAWGNQTVHQTQARTEQIAPGFEIIAQVVAKTLEGMSAVGLAEEDQQQAQAAANEVFEEVTQSEPNRGRIKSALLTLKGLLAPIAAGLSAGAAEGVQEWARTAIDQLGSSF